MSKDNLDKVFKSLKNDFDIEAPSIGHKARFLDKLNNEKNKSTKTITLMSSIWKPILGIAASLILIITISIGFNQQEAVTDLSSISPKMAQTQDFFTESISEELKKLEAQSAPETKVLIQDALKQIKILEKDYESLKFDLKNSGEDNRVIYAMISNFQNRIDILRNAMEQINLMNQLKQSSNDLSESEI
jgi:hypothetical protein